MRLWTLGLLTAALLLGSVGCVAQQEADRLRSLYRKSQEQVVDLEAQLEEAEARINALQAQQQDTADLRRQLEEARAKRDELQQALSEAKRQLQQAGSGIEIPQQLSDQLAQLAERYPDLMTYDPDLGMVKLKSDLTFALGSANVKEPALVSLRRLADVLGGQQAQPYEIRVVGHTDTVPIQNPQTRERHPTNWHLSAHRAIAVKDALENAGLQPHRMSVTGYGPYRPIAPNTQGGKEANRRVEIYLVPMSERERQMINRLEGASAPPEMNSGQNNSQNTGGDTGGESAQQDKAGPTGGTAQGGDQQKSGPDAGAQNSQQGQNKSGSGAGSAGGTGMYK